MNGFISKIGVPSIKSAPDRTISPVLVFTESILQSDKPIGFGRCGERVANKPTRLPFSLGGATFVLTWSLGVDTKIIIKL